MWLDHPEFIYIDCGAHVGKTVEAAVYSGQYDSIYAFEPCAACRESDLWTVLSCLSTVELIPVAVWTTNGAIPFYERPGKPASQSGSVMQEKISGGIDTQEPARTVECIDLSDWLRRTITKGQIAHLKLDIEGAEFDVLEHLIAEGTISLIDKLTIEWHATKLRGDGWEDRKTRILAALSALKIDVEKNKETDE